MSYVAAAVGVVAVGTSIYKGIKSNSAAKKIEQANQRPVYTIPDEFRQNAKIADHMAQTGIPQQQYENQINNIYRNQALGVQSLGRSQNPLGSIASIVRQGNDATNNLNAQDAMARQQNQRYAINQNAILGQQQLAKQQYDKFDKYTENFNKAAALRGAASKNFDQAISTGASIGGSIAGNYSGGGMGPGGGSQVETASVGQAPSIQNRGFGASYGTTSYNPNYPYTLGNGNSQYNTY